MEVCTYHTVHASPGLVNRNRGLSLIVPSQPLFFLTQVDLGFLIGCAPFSIIRTFLTDFEMLIFLAEVFLCHSDINGHESPQMFRISLNILDDNNTSCSWNNLSVRIFRSFLSVLLIILQ